MPANELTPDRAPQKSIPPIPPPGGIAGLCFFGSSATTLPGKRSCGVVMTKFSGHAVTLRSLPILFPFVLYRRKSRSMMCSLCVSIRGDYNLDKAVSIASMRVNREKPHDPYRYDS
jgi:hypothetical protein